MIIPEWIGIFVVSALILVIASFVAMITLLIIFEGIQSYYKRLFRQVGIMDARQFRKEYQAWKLAKELEQGK